MGGWLVELGQKLGGNGLHRDGLHLDTAKKIAMGNEAWNSHGESSDCRIEGLRDPTGNHNRIPCPAERSEDPNKTGKRSEQTDERARSGCDFKDDEAFFHAG